MQQNFDTILGSEEGVKFLLNLPYEQMKSIAESNSLNIKDEYVLVDLFEKYLKHRDNLPQLAEDKRNINDYLDLLSDTEKEKIKTDKAAKEAEE